MAGIPAVAAVVTAVASIGVGVAGHIATQRRNKAEARARQVEQRVASVEHQRRIRRAIAERRIREAETRTVGEEQGVATGSAVAGATGALRTQTAANIGAATTQFAGQQAQANILARGHRRAARAQSFGGFLESVGQATHSFGGFVERHGSFGEAFQRNNRG